MREKNHVFQRKRPSKPNHTNDINSPGQQFRVSQLGLDAQFAQEVLRFKSMDPEQTEPSIPPQVERDLRRDLQGGDLLDRDLASEFGQSMGADFREVRIHTDSEADRLCRLLSAEAFTWNGHIWFREGKYDPLSESGRRLIAHELTHILQQRGESIQPLQRKLHEEDGEQIKKYLKRRFTKRELWKTLVLFAPYSSEEISSFWAGLEENQDHTLDLLKRSRWKHFYAFPREMAALVETLPREVRIAQIQGIYEKPFKKKEGIQDLDAIRILYLIQGLSPSDLAEAEASGKLSPEAIPLFMAKLPAGYLGVLRNAKETYAPEQEILQNGQEGEGSELLDIAREESQELERVYKEIRKFLHQDRLLGKVSSPYMLKVPSHKAIRAYELLAELPDGLRAKFARRYSDLVGLIEINIPQSYRSRPDYGYHTGIPEEEIEPLLLQIVDRENWSGTDLRSNRLEVLISMGIQADAGALLDVAVKDNIRLVAGWPDTEQNVRTFALCLFVLNQNVDPEAGMPESIVSLVSAIGQGAFLPVAQQNGFVEGSWTQPEGPDYSQEFGVGPLIWKFLSVKNQAVKRARKAARQQGRDFDRSQFDERISTHLQAAGFFKDGKGELYLEDFNLADLQSAMGGSVIGVEFLGPQYDAEGNPSEQSRAFGNLMAKINEERALLSAEALPFSGINYEAGTYGFKSGPGHFMGLEGEFYWLPSEGKDVGSLLKVQDLVLNNLRIIDPLSTIAIGRLRIQGLQVQMDQAVADAESMYGLFGLNLIFGLTEGINQMVFLTLNALMVAVEKLLPQAGLESGQDLSKQLLEDLNADLRFGLQFSRVEVENVFSNSGLLLETVSLGASELNIGGTVADYYRKKVVALEAIDPPTVETIGQIAYYKDLIRYEDEADQRISQLEAELDTLPETESRRRQEILFDLGQLRSLQSLKFSLVTEEVSMDALPIPEGRFEMIGGLDTYAFGKTEEEREAKKLELLSQASQGVFAADNSSLSDDFFYLETVGLNAGTYEQFTQGWVGGRVKMLEDQWIFDLFLPSIDTQKWPDLSENGILFSPINADREAPLSLIGLGIRGVLQLNSSEEQKTEGIAIRQVDLHKIRVDQLDMENIRIEAAGQIFDFKGSTTLLGAEIRDISIGLNEDYSVGEIDLSGFVFTADSLGGSQALAQLAGMVEVRLPEFKANGIEFGTRKREISEFTVTDPDTEEEKNYEVSSEGYYFNIDEFEGSRADFTYEGQKVGFDRISEIKGTWLNYKETEKGQTSETKNYDILDISFRVDSLKAGRLSYGKQGDSFRLSSFITPSDPMQREDQGFAYLYDIFAHLTVRFANPTTAEVEQAKKEEKDPPASYLEAVHLNTLSIGQSTVHNVRINYNGNTYKIQGGGSIYGLVFNGIQMDFDSAGEMDFAFDPGGGVVLDSMFFESVTDTFSTIENLGSGRVEFRRLSSDTGYYYEVNNLTGDLTYYDTGGAPPTSSAVVNTYAKALLGGMGATVKGTYFDNRTLYANFEIPDSLEINGLYWKDGTGNYVWQDQQGQTELTGIQGELVTRLAPKNSTNPLEYLKIKSMHVDTLKCLGLNVKANTSMGNFDLSLPLDAPAKMADIWLTNIHYNFASKKFTGDINAGMVDLTTHINRVDSPMIGLLKGQPRLMLDELNFSLNDEGTIDVQVMGMNLYLPGAGKAEHMRQKKGYFATDDLRLYFASADVQGALPVISSGVTHFVMETDENHGKEKNFSVYMQDPTIRDLFISFEKLAGIYRTHFSGLKLDGQALGELEVIDTDDALLVTVRPLTDRFEGPQANEGYLDFMHAELWTDNLWEMVRRNKPEENPDAPPTPQVTEDTYENTGYFDFLNLASSGTVEIELWGTTFPMPIETVRPSVLQFENGFVDFNLFLDRIKLAYLQGLIPGLDDVLDDVAGFWGNIPPNFVNIMMLEAKVQDGEYVLESTLNIDAMTLIPQSYRNVYTDYDSKREMMRLAPFLDYLVNGPSEEEPDDSPLPQKLGTFSSETPWFQGMNPQVRIKDLEFNMYRWRDDDVRRGPFLGWLVDDLNDDTRINLELQIDASAYNGQWRFDTDYDENSTETYRGDKPLSNMGTKLIIRDSYFPGFRVEKDMDDGSYKRMEVSGSKIDIGYGEVDIEDLRLQETKIDVNNVKLYGFTLKLFKR